MRCPPPEPSGSAKNDTRLLAFIEQAPVAIAMFDREMRYIRASRRWRTAYGLGNRDLVGVSHYDIFPEISDGWKKVHQRGLAGETIKEEEDRFDRADGSVQWLHWEIQPWQEESGAVGGIMIFSEDITDRKEAEQAVRESEEKFRVLSEAMPQMVWASDREGKAYYLNSRWLEYTGQTFEEATGLGWLNAVHPEDLSRAQDQWTAAVKTGTAYEVEYRIKQKDGRYRWFISRGLPKRGASAEIEQWVGTCTDIDDQKTLEGALKSARDAAEEATRAKSEFLANMSHEIRTPMTVFMAAIEQLSQKDQDPESRSLLELADASASRLLNLIEDILDFSRIEARRLDIQEAAFDLRSCVDEAVGLFALAAREKALRLTVALGPETPEKVMGDSRRLGQVLVNLVGNAVKFTPQGEVHVSVRLRRDDLEFTIADTGIGIPPEKHHLLFQSFSQVDSSLTRRYGGSGLGLAISKGLVELMGGNISARNREDAGAEFTFNLPLHLPGEDLALSPPANKRPGPALVPKILLAEDDPTTREILHMVLIPRGWQVETAESGGQTLQKWEEGRFDLILMDVQMPGINGLEATRRIRSQEAKGNRRTCIIGLTAHAQSHVRKKCLDAGMDEVLFKPVLIKDLYAAIEKIPVSGA